MDIQSLQRREDRRQIEPYTRRLALHGRDIRSIWVERWILDTAAIWAFSNPYDQLTEGLGGERHPRGGFPSAALILGRCPLSCKAFRVTGERDLVLVMCWAGFGWVL